ncbi:hypothetical protein ACP275_11G106100 [Erythranthe tilingii]
MLNISSEAYSMIAQQICERGWHDFCKQPDSANVTLVRELYANHYSDRRPVSHVRGKDVVWDSDAINDYHKIRRNPKSASWADIKATTTREQVAEKLCPMGPDWESNYLKLSSVNHEGKAWIYFISARIIPTTATSIARFDRCALAYHIMTGTPLDIGGIIEEQILHCIKDQGTSLYFPSLITGLCQNAGVEGNPKDDIKPPQRVITDATISSYAQVAGRANPEPLPPREEPMTKAELSQTIRQIQQEVGGLRKDHEDFRQEMKATMSWIGNMVKSVGTKLQFDLSDCVEPVSVPPPEVPPPVYGDEEHVHERDAPVESGHI